MEFLQIKGWEFDTVNPLHDPDAYGLIGLSLSASVYSIMKGQVPIEHVMCVIARTNIETPQQAYDLYSNSTFHEFDKASVLLVLQWLWPRLVQPRRFNCPTPVGSHNWIRIPARPS